MRHPAPGLGYYEPDTDRLLRVPVDGGRPETVCETQELVDFDWIEDGIVLTRRLAGLGRCEYGGEPTALTITNPDLDERQHTSPHSLPGGAGILFGVRKVPDGYALAVLAKGEAEPRLLGVNGHSPRYLPSGHIVYVAGRGLRAVEFDLSRLEVSGESFSTQVDLSARSDFAIANDGTLIYISSDLKLPRRSLVWADRDGGNEPVGMPPMNIFRVQISPSGKRVAFEAREPGQEVWVWDFEREALTRVTFDPTGSGVPRWSSEQSLLFESHRIPPGNVHEKAADGTGTAERVFASPNHQVPMSLSPDGKYLVIEERIGASGNYDLVIFSYETQTVETLAATEFKETSAEISPNGRFVAYQSDELGRPEVYVRPFPDVQSRKWSISTSGGSHPTWSRDGRELFFLDGEGLLSAVDVQPGEDFTAGRPRTILHKRYYDPTDRGNPYDVSPDGTRFLMIEENEAAVASEIHMVVNWFEELERLAAAAKN